MTINTLGIHKITFYVWTASLFFYTTTNPMDIAEKHTYGINSMPLEYIAKHGYGNRFLKLQKQQQEQKEAKRGKLFIETDESGNITGRIKGYESYLKKEISQTISNNALQNSQIIKNMILDLSTPVTSGIIKKIEAQSEQVPLPLDITTEDLHTGFMILDLYPNSTKTIPSFLKGIPQKQLINVINLFTILEIPKKISTLAMNQLSSLTKNMDPNQTEIALKDLNPDVQKQFFIDHIISYLKKSSLEKNGPDQKIPLNVYSSLCTQFSPDGKQIISISPNQEYLFLRNSDNGEVVKTLDSGQKNISFIQFSHNGKYLVSTNYEKKPSIILWDLSDYSWKNLCDDQSCPTDGDTDRYAREVKIKALFTPDDAKIITGAGSTYNNLTIWNLADNTHVKLAGHPPGVDSINISPDGARMVSRRCHTRGYDNENFILWDLTNNTMIKELNHYERKVTQIVFSPDSSQFISIAPSGKRYSDDGRPGGDEHITIWNAVNGEKIKELKPSGQSYIRSATFSPDGNLIITASGDMYYPLVVSDAQTSRVIKDLGQNQLLVHPANSVSFSHDGTLFLSTHDQILPFYLWDATTFTKIGEFEGGSFGSISATFCPNDNTKIISIGEGKGTILWNLYTKELKDYFDSLKALNLKTIQLLYRMCYDREKKLRHELTSIDYKALKEKIPKTIQNLVELDTFGNRLINIIPSAKPQLKIVPKLTPPKPETAKEIAAVSVSEPIPAVKPIEQTATGSQVIVEPAIRQSIAAEPTVEQNHSPQKQNNPNSNSLMQRFWNIFNTFWAYFFS